MSEDIERHVVRKFEICQRLGKGVSSLVSVLLYHYNCIRPMVLFGKLSKRDLEQLWL